MNEEIEINVRKLRPFTRFIYTIGELPTSYLISMTYEEQLIWLCNYLEKTVIPAINNNAQAVEELQNLFVELQEYVNNYFENLDVQEEINNKLDDMVESGELENIISQYIQLATTYVYNNVSEMKEATNLVDGSFARTSGFYSYNDGGGATYKIRTVTVEDTVDEKTIIALTETLIAELIFEKEMNVRQFGAKGDGETDDTLSIQTAFDNCKNIIIDNGTYMVDATTSIQPKSNSYIKLINATIKAITTDTANYEVIYINNKENIVIEGGTIEGERTTHTGDTGEWGHCIRIDNGSKNITIKNTTIKDAWGDGIYLKNGININTQNIVCDNNRRQGISIIKVDGYHSLNDKIINTNGTNPQSAIDIEPNSSTDYIKNVILENLYTENNTGSGVDINLFNLDGTSDTVSIKIINHHDISSLTGENFTLPKTIKHDIITENALLENNNYGIRLRDCFDNGVDKIQIIRPTIINCNYNTEITASYVCGITCFTNDTTTDSLGGVTVIEPYITSKFETARRGINFYDSTNTVKCSNVDIINPRNKQNNLKLYAYGDIRITDLYEKYIVKGNDSFTLTYYDLYSGVSNINFTATRTITLNEDVPTNFEIKFINEKATNPINIQMSNTEYVRYFNNNTGNLILLNDMNSSITLKKISEHEWIVTNLIGSVTISQ